MTKSSYSTVEDGQLSVEEFETLRQQLDELKKTFTALESHNREMRAAIAQLKGKKFDKSDSPKESHIPFGLQMILIVVFAMQVLQVQLLIFGKA